MFPGYALQDGLTLCFRQRSQPQSPPGGTENGHPLPKPHRRRVERRMPTAGDIDQFIFIHHPHRGVLFGPAGDVFDNRPYHARKLRRIDIGLAKPQRLWGKPVIAPVGLQIALMQERQQKTSRGALRQAAHFRRLGDGELWAGFGKKLN